jgi:hypothetical protein
MRNLGALTTEELRDRFSLGATTTELAEEYGITERHVRRLVHDLEPPASPVFTVSPGETVSDALNLFLTDIGSRDPQGDVLAATARKLAQNLDRADSRSAPALARALVDVLDQLNGTTELDGIAELRRRRDARPLLDQAAH